MPRSGNSGRIALVHLGAALLAALWLITRAGGVEATALFANIAEAAAALYAGVACARTARRMQGAERRAWVLLSAGASSWSAGQCLWTWHENVAGVAVPFPSLADVGFLALVPFTVAGAATLITAGRGAARMLLDGLIIAGSLFYLSWATVLGPLYHAAGATDLEWLVTLAYPTGDIVVGSAIFILFGHVRRDQRPVLGVLGAGYVALAGADTGFAYLINQGAYSSATLSDVGWIWGFLAIGAAAALQRHQGQARVFDTDRVWLVLPYVPLGVAVIASVVVTVRSGTVGPMLYTLSTLLVILVVIRQLLSVLDNQRLTGTLRAAVRDLRRREADLRASQEQLMAREEQLRRLAYTDALTGVANRSALFDRIDDASALPGRDGCVTLLYVDLDGFKAVNDRYGHAIGDALLVGVAQRVRRKVGDRGLLARLGGDEFAVLAEHGHPDRAAELARGIVACLNEAFTVAGHTLTITASIGVASQPASAVHRAELLRRADAAMYTAKAAGKGTFHVADAEVRPSLA